MTETEIHKKLAAISDAHALSPDNHDRVNIALGLLNAESAEKLKQSTEELSGRITGMGIMVSQSMEQQARKIIESNEKLAASNEYSAKVLTLLTWILVAIGVIQIVILLFQIFSSK